MKRVTSHPHNFVCLSSYTDYRYRQGQKLLFKCLDCEKNGKETITEHTLFNFERNPICKICNPGGSKEQLEIADFIKSLGFDVIYNDRTAISPKELDVYVPSKKFAIEYDSFYWHSWSEEDPREDRHLEKTLACEKNGITLIHVFQDEWLQKRHIIESMITHRLGVTPRKIYARKCELRSLDSKSARTFFEINHIAGYARAGIACFGLYFADELVAAMSFRKPFHRDAYAGKAEMSRFATLSGVAVTGGMRKLLRAGVKACKCAGYDGILTYADMRYGQGKSYLDAGMCLKGRTPPGYDYHDGVKRSQGLNSGHLRVFQRNRSHYRLASKGYMDAVA